MGGQFEMGQATLHDESQAGMQPSMASGSGVPPPFLTCELSTWMQDPT